VVEAVITALVGTLLGIGGGWLALRWLLHMFTTETVPELGVPALIGTTSIVLTIALGVGVAALAPLFAIRRLQRIDIPATLRVLE
jgi:putative ABC transport system permease protein